MKKHLQNLKMLIDQTGNGDAEETDIIPEDKVILKFILDFNVSDINCVHDVV